MAASINSSVSPMMEAIVNFTNALYDPECFDLIAKEEIRDALSKGQLESKMWLLENFPFILNHYQSQAPLKTVVVGGWIGLLARALNHFDERITADTSDINPNATIIAKLTLDKIRGNALTQDMFEMDYSPYQCIVNTSTEHIEDIKAWVNKIPSGRYIVAQNNNAPHIPGHISCASSCEDFVLKLGLQKVLYSGKMGFSDYDRYMVIGIK